MTTLRRWWLTIVVLCQVLAAPAWAKDPFSVEVSMAVAETGRVLSVAFSIPANHHLYAEQIKVEPVGGIALVPLSIPPAKQKKDPVSGAIVSVYESNTTFSYLIHGDVATGAAVRVRYQGCSETECFFPVTRTLSLSPEPPGAVGSGREPDVSPAGTPSAAWQESVKRFSLVGRSTGYMRADEFMQFLDNAETGQGIGQDRLQTLFAGKGIGMWVALLLIVLGGLGLNLTPCVLPMIPINLAIIGAGVQAGSRRRGLALGFVYGAGMALAYGGLGVFVVLTGAKFGALNSSPVFNAVVAIIFVVLSLAMFDVLAIDLSRFQGTTPGTVKRGSLATAFVMGAVSALLAGACVAPVVVSVLLLATDLYHRSPVIGLLLPFLLGVGMALPWPFAGAGLSFLPKPGRWMEGVKRGFGVLILVMAGWYGYLSYSLIHDRTQRHKAEVVEAQTAAARNRGWMTSLDDALLRAEKEQKLLIVDCWASWCKNCLVMDETTFQNAEVIRRLEPYVKLKYQAEDLEEPAVKAVLDHFGVVGLPTYVVLKPNRAGTTPGAL